MLRVQRLEPISSGDLDRFVEVAANAAGYEEGFGVRGCDLSKPIWWAAYARQSLEEQTQNNRLSDYLRTCAQEAKRLGVVVPREYVFYDAVTGEHLERPAISYVRKELVPGRKIEGVIFPALDRLSREPIHIGIFEFELDHFGVKYHYADAPNGSDPMSQMVRQNLAHAAKFVKLANRKNNRGGNIGRVLKGLAPAHRAAYGYRYCADKEIAPNGRVVIKRAWWEIDELGPDGEPRWDSPAWVVAQVFTWVGDEGRSLHWVVKQLNEMGIKTAEGGKWSPSRIAKVLHRRCYTGEHAYNVNARVPNPDRPLGDITAEVKRTLVRPKPKEEWVSFKVPPLVSEELWHKACVNISERGRGRGKQGKVLQALLRGRIFCPKCGKPMVVRRGGHQKLVYYHCSRYYQSWAKEPCDYRRFIPGAWEETVWQDVCSWLRNDVWVEQQMASEHSQDENIEKLIRLQQFKISQAQNKVARVREGFEGSIYSLDEAKRRIADHQGTIAKAEEEIRRLKESLKTSARSTSDMEAMREEFRMLRDRNLDEASFEEKLEIISKLGIKIYPSEDLKTMRVVCQFNLPQMQSGSRSGTTESTELQAKGECESAVECGKVMFGGAGVTVGRTFTLAFSIT